MPDRGEKGFTLIELIMVIVLISIVAAAVSPFIFRGTNPVSVGAFARKVKDDIRYAQTLALLRSNLDTPDASNPTFSYRIKFNTADANCTGTNQYAIVNDADSNGTWGENPNASGSVESARNPASGADYFCVQLDSGDYNGFTVSADFGGSVPGVLEFDNTGTPYDSDGIKLTAAKTLTVARGSETMTITVTPNTGMVALQ